MGFLDRPGRHREFRNLPELALIREPLLGPGLLNNVQRLLIALAILQPRDAKPREVLGVSAAPDPENEASTAQDIEHGEVLRLAEWILQREDAEGRAEPQAGRLSCQGGQKELRARTDAKRIEMLLARPDRIKTELLGIDHEVQGVFVVGDLILAIGEKVKQGKQAELHSRSSFRSMRPECLRW